MPSRAWLCRRILFDFEKLDRVKVTDYFEFPLVLDMAPYLENGDLDHLRGTATAGSGAAGSAPASPPGACALFRGCSAGPSCL